MYFCLNNLSIWLRYDSDITVNKTLARVYVSFESPLLLFPTMVFAFNLPPPVGTPSWLSRGRVFKQWRDSVSALHCTRFLFFDRRTEEQNIFFALGEHVACVTMRQRIAWIYVNGKTSSHLDIYPRNSNWKSMISVPLPLQKVVKTHAVVRRL